MELADRDIVIKSGTRLNVWLLQPRGSFVMKLLHKKLWGSGWYLKAAGYW